MYLYPIAIAALLSFLPRLSLAGECYVQAWARPDGDNPDWHLHRLNIPNPSDCTDFSKIIQEENPKLQQYVVPAKQYCGFYSDDDCSAGYLMFYTAPGSLPSPSEHEVVKSVICKKKPPFAYHVNPRNEYSVRRLLISQPLLCSGQVTANTKPDQSSLETRLSAEESIITLAEFGLPADGVPVCHVRVCLGSLLCALFSISSTFITFPIYLHNYIPIPPDLSLVFPVQPSFDLPIGRCM